VNEHRISLVKGQETISAICDLADPDRESYSYPRPVKHALDENENLTTWLNGQDSIWQFTTCLKQDTRGCGIGGAIIQQETGSLDYAGCQELSSIREPFIFWPGELLTCRADQIYTIDQGSPYPLATLAE
jgi:hypothetical protein